MKNKSDVVSCEGVCYDCPNKYSTTHCGNEDMKYNVIINDIKSAINMFGDKKFWMSVDWDENDEVAMRAWKKVEKWLKDRGYKCGSMTYRKFIVYSTDGKPVVSCGHHTGTVYIRKESN